MMVMKFKFQKSSLAQGSFKALGGPTEICSQDLKLLQNLQKMVKPQVLNKDDVVHIHNERLLSHKEWNNAICSNMAGLRNYQTKWS